MNEKKKQGEATGEKKTKTTAFKLSSKVPKLIYTFDTYQTITQCQQGATKAKGKPNHISQHQNLCPCTLKEAVKSQAAKTFKHTKCSKINKS